MMAFIRVLALTLALASSSAWCSHLSGSARDQYEAREDSPQPQMLAEATDHRPEVQMSHSNFINKSTNSSKQIVAPNLQVGYGDGFIQEKKQEKKKLHVKKKVTLRVRRKRSYYAPSPGQVAYDTPYQSINVWHAPRYPLSRPYLIPIYGVSGRVPIFFPPQPIYINSGVPRDNPNKRPFKGPSYLPPDESTTVPTASSTMEVGYRYDDDDRPIWDMGNNVQQRPQTTQRPFTTTTSVVPTRMTRPPGAPKRPPLVHRPTDPQGFQPAPQNSGDDNKLAPPALQEVLPPPAAQASPQRPNEPSRCVWAIISCCSDTNQISYECFDQRGCPGAFWDTNPCDNDFSRAAISAALNYYNNNN